MAETTLTTPRTTARRWLSNDNTWLLAGALFLAYILLLAGDVPHLRFFLDNPRWAASVLHGEYVSDLAQDLVGFRRLVTDRDPYPVLGPAFHELGIIWDVPAASTHPPTAFLLVAPVALLPYPVASSLWGFSGLVLLSASLRLHGLSWKQAIGLTPFLLLWTPAVGSLGQLTVLWLFGLAVAFRFRHRHAWIAGLGIGLAAATKLVPALVAALFLLKRKPGVLVGFLLAFGGLTAIALALSPEVFSRYLEINRINGAVQMLRADNGSPLLAMQRWFGVPGLLVAVGFIGWVLYRNRAAFLTPGISERAFHVTGFLTVCALPVAWNYSVLPLLPLVLFLLRAPHRLTVAYAACALLVGAIMPEWGPGAAVGVVVALALIGRALLFPPSE